MKAEEFDEFRQVLKWEAYEDYTRDDARYEDIHSVHVLSSYYSSLM